MESNEISKILEVYHSKDYSDKIIRWRDFLKVSIGDYPNLSNSWLSLTKFKEFDFVRDIINKDLQNIDNDYRCANFDIPNGAYQGPITFMIYKKGDFITEHRDGSSYGGGILSSTYNFQMGGGYLLNNEYKGGNFILDGKKLEVGVGEVFTYGRDVLHEVTEVIEGIRYSLHFFIDKV
jgi:hypothetical protein